MPSSFTTRPPCPSVLADGSSPITLISRRSSSYRPLPLVVSALSPSANTIGTANSGPKVGPIVISEIMYHPSDIAIGTNGLDNVDDEFVELQNISGSTVNLYDAANPANTWHLRDAVDFDFPQNISIPAGGFVLVVGFDP